MSKKEKNCLNCRIHWDREGCCEVCRWEDDDNPSLFYQITRSPEVLVESLVFWEGGWTSRFIKFTTTNRDEAIAATLEELNKGSK